MIPAIALMVGLYIITRMIHLLIDKHKETSIVTAAMALATILIAIYAVGYCLIKGAEAAKLLP